MADILASPNRAVHPVFDSDAAIITTFGIALLALFAALLMWLPFDAGIEPESVITYFGP
jgi:hypothetical protein